MFGAIDAASSGVALGRHVDGHHLRQRRQRQHRPARRTRSRSGRASSSPAACPAPTASGSQDRRGQAGQPEVVYDPDNPLADADGYVTRPVVDLSEEMTNMLRRQPALPGQPLGHVTGPRRLPGRTLQIGTLTMAICAVGATGAGDIRPSPADAPRPQPARRDPGSGTRQGPRSSTGSSRLRSCRSTPTSWPARSPPDRYRTARLHHRRHQGPARRRR